MMGRIRFATQLARSREGNAMLEFALGGILVAAFVGTFLVRIFFSPAQDRFIFRGEQPIDERKENQPACRNRRALLPATSREFAPAGRSQQHQDQ